MLVLTVIIMQRYRINTVTNEAGLPILIPSSSASDGVATFLPEDQEPQSVRAFRDSDLKHVKKYLVGDTWLRFEAVMKLKGSLESPGDPIAQEAALRALAEANRNTRSGPQNPLCSSTPPDVPDHLVMDVAEDRLSGKKLIAMMEQYAGLRPGKTARQDAKWLLSYTVSMEFKEARLVLWWSDQKFRPALWCPDMKTAYYSRILLGVVGGKGFGVCPKCGVLFVRNRPDQTYCMVKHREAHRVARWRAMQSLKKTTVTKRRSNGTHKAR
jgi:hypothetical protein